MRQGLEIADCAAATRIRERYLVAIEDGRYESLPDPAYVNGFVRAYASHLGVAVPQPVRDLPVEPRVRAQHLGASPAGGAQRHAHHPAPGRRAAPAPMAPRAGGADRGGPRRGGPGRRHRPRSLGPLGRDDHAVEGETPVAPLPRTLEAHSMATCASCRSSIPAGARFCPACAHPVAQPVALGDERKLATVLFADLVGSTRLADAEDPERTRAMLTRFYDAMADEVVAGGGTIDKFIGDAVMAVFGAPTAQEDHAERALHAALAMRRRLREVFDGALSLRIGLNTGEVVVGGGRESGSFVTGDAVNVAARLEAAAEPGEILVGARTVAAARGAFELAEPLTIEAKGKAGGVVCHRLVGALSSNRTAEARSRVRRSRGGGRGARAGLRARRQRCEPPVRHDHRRRGRGQDDARPAPLARTRGAVAPAPPAGRPLQLRGHGDHLQAVGGHRPRALRAAAERSGRDRARSAGGARDPRPDAGDGGSARSPPPGRPGPAASGLGRTSWRSSSRGGPPWCSWRTSTGPRTPSSACWTPRCRTSEGRCCCSVPPGRSSCTVIRSGDVGPALRRSGWGPCPPRTRLA